MHRSLINCIVLLVAASSTHAIWGPEQNIIPPQYTYGGSWTASNGAHSLAVAGDTIYLVWTDARVILANSGHQVIFKEYDGSAWGGDSVIGYGGNWRNHNWYPSCTRDGNGRLHVVWESNDYESGNGYDLSYRSLYQGIWSAQLHAVSSPSNTWYPVIAAGAGGKVYICWQDDRDGGFRLYYKVLDAAGWSGEIAIPGSQVYATFPSLTSAGNTATVAWQDFRSGVSQIYVKEFGAQGWGEDSALSHSSQGAYTPCLASDASGDYHLTWEDWRDNNAEIYYRRYDHAAHAWDPEVRVSNDPWRSRAPVLVCRGDSLVDVFWEDDRSGYYQIMSREALRGSWSAETTLTTGLADNRCPSVCADDRGNLHLVWSNCGIDPPLARPDLFAMSNIINPWPKSGPAGPVAATVPGPYPIKVFPNPSPGPTTILFHVDSGSGPDQPIGVYSITGQLLRTIKTSPAAGNARAVLWDGKDGHGRPAASGVYLIAVRQGQRTGTVKFTLVR